MTLLCLTPPHATSPYLPSVPEFYSTLPCCTLPIDTERPGSGTGTLGVNGDGDAGGVGSGALGGSGDPGQEKRKAEEVRC